MKALGRVVPAQIEKGLPGMGGGQCAIYRGQRRGDEPGYQGEKPDRDQYLGGGDATEAARGSRKRVDTSWTRWPVAAAVRRMVWSVAKTGRASENVTSVRVQKSPSWSWYLRRKMTPRVMVGHGKGQRRPRERRGRKGVALREGNPADIPTRCYFEGPGAGVWCAPGAFSLVCGLWPTPRGES